MSLTSAHMLPILVLLPLINVLTVKLQYRATNSMSSLACNMQFVAIAPEDEDALVIVFCTSM
jgi:hypothetical protein